MEEKEIIAARVRELSRRAAENEYLTCTVFYSVSEQDEAAAAARGARYFAYGGYEDAERKVFFFLPSYLSPEDVTAQEEAEGEHVACVKITLVGAKFSELPGHRDYLGAIMSLGIGRERIGDILNEEKAAYVFALRPAAELITKELSSVRHTVVKCEMIPPGQCDARPSFHEVQGSVASERVDAVLSMVYHLSRARAQELIERELVFADGRTVRSAAHELREGSRGSVRGFGKFIYDGVLKTTKKDRRMVSVRVFD